MVMMMIPHLVTEAHPGGLAVQVEEASRGLIGSSPAVFSLAFFEASLTLSPPSLLALRLTWQTLCACHHILMDGQTS